jgi:hypothetical protein
MYDIIFIGSSLSNMLASTTITNKKILIIEKDSYLGGAWRVNSNDKKNIDLVGHLIVPEDNIKGQEIINFFKKIGIELEKIKDSDFAYETELFKGNNKQGDSIICKNGWVNFNLKIIEYVKSFKHIDILLDCEINSINCHNNYIDLVSQNNIFKTKKLVIPMYCNIDKINYDNHYLEIPFQKIENIHVLISVSYDSITITKKFQAFLDKEPLGVFDRIIVSEIDKVNKKIILSCRISKNFKKKNDIENFFYDFLVNKKIINENSKILDIYYYNYNCSYRDASKNRMLMYNSIEKINNFYGEKKLILLNTIYMGHFLTLLVNNDLNII